MAKRLRIVPCLLVAALLGCTTAGDRSIDVPSRTSLAAHSDGAIESLSLILRTRRSEYFALTYWSDGLRVKGFLGRPRSGGKHPAVVYNRGGNREFGALRGPELVAFVEAGYVAASSQYRGNAGGEGREEFGGTDVDDVMNLVRFLQNDAAVDPQRIGMVGFSRGGMMTFLALKHDATHSIKAAATIGGPSDLIALIDARPDMVSVYQELIGGWPDNVAAYEQRSAVKWPEAINTPLLLLHGEEDARVPVDQSRTLADLLRREGKTVKLVTYPGDDHGLSAHNGGYPTVFAWLGKYLAHAGEDLTYETHHDAMVKTLARWLALIEPDQAASRP